jgi:hypothetical protein
MTVIAYRAGVMAADTGVVDCGDTFTKWGNTQKIKRLPNKGLIACSGHLFAGEQLAITLSRAIKKCEIIFKEMFEPFTGCTALYVDPHGTVWGIQGGMEGGIVKLTGEFFADGSGSTAALAAFHCGASAERAVAVAILVDAGCGGDIQVEVL